MPQTKSASLKPASRQTKFQDRHRIQFGLNVQGRNPTTGDVCSVRCQFCVYYGHETIPGQKRQRQATDNVKDWGAPFRSEGYREHHKSQHPVHWAEYELLNNEEKQKYFSNKMEYKDTLFSHFEPQDSNIVYHIDAKIVEKIIGEMFFHPDDSEGICSVFSI